MATDGFDLVLVGGGLQNGLIALSALAAAPACRIALVERDPQLGGNHTWCVHARDVPARAQAWFEPLVVQRWAGYEVRFPGFTRTVDSSYAVISSERFDSVVRARLAQSPGCQLLLGRRAHRIARHQVELDDGQVLRGRLVVDARGPDPRAYASHTGYQKFLGQELILRAPHGLARPLLMDATCSQHDGFRFFYLLPLAPDRLLIEETRFSCTPQLDAPSARAAIAEYASRFGAVASCAREEQGILPMPWSMARERPAQAGPLVAGYRGGYFHPATGYSMPAALRVAEILGDHVMREPLGVEWQRFEREHRIQTVYALQLNRLLFTGFAESHMWGVLARFYHLPQAAIERFYALDSSVLDRVRILVGRPPRGFSLRRALAAAIPLAKGGAA